MITRQIVNHTFLLQTIFTVLLLTSCAKYTPRPLNQANGTPSVQKDVSIAASPLSDEECFHYFSRHAVRKGYQPIVLTVKNNSSTVYMLDANNINLNIESRDVVAKQLHLNTSKRVATWGIGALFLWPFIIPAACDGVNSSNANKALDKDFSERVIDRTSRIIIKPYSLVNKVIFVTTNNYRQMFELDLFDKERTEKLSFNLQA